MNTLKRLLSLPGPKEMGRSDGDWLPLRTATPFVKGYTWEDWEAEMRSKHPVRWLLTESLPRAARRIAYRIGSAWHWVADRTVRRNHLVDLRRAGGGYGYVEPCDALRLACWACLVSYVEDSQPFDPADRFTPEDLAHPAVAGQKAVYDEVMSLYRWWTVGRLEDIRLERSRYADVESAAERLDEQAYGAAVDGWLSVRESNEERDEANLRRLVELRRHLWT